MSVMVWYGSMISGFFFFKQKTAYEMRISDWSSDVCSSDLQVVAEADRIHRAVGRGQRHDHQEAAGGALDAHALLGHRTRQPRLDAADAVLHLDLRLADRRSRLEGDGRSEEHTSELQSLMRNSYAVFCLKKKKETYQHSKYR